MKKALVIGAGIAGITAAIKLAEKGIGVTLVERRSYPGGRAFSNIDFKTGEIIDNGQHIFAGAYTVFFEILEKLDSKKHIFSQPALKVKFYDRNSNPYTIDTALLPGQLGTIAALIRIKKLGFLSKLKFLPFFIKILFNQMNIDGLTAEELLNNEKQDIYSRKYFWEPLILATCNGSPKNVSANLFVNVLKRAFFSTKENSSLVFSKVPFSTLFDSIDDYLKQRNGIVLYNKTAKKIICNGNSVDSVLFEDGDEIKADYYISCITTKELFSILPQDLLRHYPLSKKLIYSPITSVYLWYDTEFLTDDFAGLIDSPVQWIFNRRKIAYCTPLIKLNYPGHYSLTISASDCFAEMRNAEIIALCLKEIEEYFPAVRLAKLLRCKVIKDRKSTLLMNADSEILRPAQKTILSNFSIAGDWTDTQLPATIEGAAISGVRAVSVLL